MWQQNSRKRFSQTTENIPPADVTSIVQRYVETKLLHLIKLCVCVCVYLHRHDSWTDDFKLMFCSFTFAVLMTVYQFAGLFVKDARIFYAIPLRQAESTRRSIQRRLFSRPEAAQCCRTLPTFHGDLLPPSSKRLSLRSVGSLAPGQAGRPGTRIERCSRTELTACCVCGYELLPTDCM